MYLKRYLIVVPTLLTPFIPAEGADIHPHYFPSLVELTITAGAFATFLLLFTLFSRVFPILSIWETAEDAAERASDTAAVASLPKATRPLAATVTAVLLVVGLTLVPTTSAGAAGPQEQQTRVDLARSSEDGKEMLVATVTVDGRPASGVKIGFYVQRLLGLLLLGEDETLEDGTAAVDFPTSLPGDARGALRVRVAVLSPDSLAGASVERVLRGGQPKQIAREEFPRALWAPRAPIGLLGTIAFLLLCVWSTYAFAIRQLVGIRLAKEE
jgi:hypothetical protein